MATHVLQDRVGVRWLHGLCFVFTHDYSLNLLLAFYCHGHLFYLLWSLLTYFYLRQSLTLCPLTEVTLYADQADVV